MSAHFPPPPPPPRIRVDSRELRPGRLGYAVGAAFIVLGIVAGVVGFGVMLYRTVALPEFSARVEGSAEAVFTVVPEPGEIGLYSSPAGADESACRLVTPDGEEESFGFPPYGHSIGSGSRSWSLVGSFSHDGEGEYTLVCEGDPGTVYAVAEVEDGAGFFATITGAMAAFVGLPFAGLVVGLPILITTGARRNRHKRRLLGERARYPRHS